MSTAPSFASFPDFEGPSEPPKDSRKLKHKSRDDKVHHHHRRRSPKPADTGYNSLFYLDTKGDTGNSQYGALSRKDVPSYRLNRKYILGDDRRNNEHRIGMNSNPGAITDPESRRLLRQQPIRLRTLPPTTMKYQEVDGFLRLRKEHPTLATPLLENCADSESDDTASDGSSDSENDIHLSSQQETLKTLETYLLSNPASVDSWLALLSRTLSTTPILSQDATRVRSEIAISVLSRAFKANPANKSALILCLKYLAAGENIWEREKLDHAWETVLEQVAGPEVWVHWLEYRLRIRISGTTNLVEAASRAMGALGSSEVDEIMKLRIFWRSALALQQAGYVEMGFAMFQAEAELIFAVPTALEGLSSPDILDQLAEYWDADLPRLGELRAEGWDHWYTHGKKSDASPQAIPEESSMYSSDPYEHWAHSELHADRHKIIPCTSTEVDDPYATILFEDIRPLLFAFTSQSTRNAFRMAWLALLGLHIPGFSSSLSFDSRLSNFDTKWSSIHLMRPTYLDVIFPSKTERKHLLADSVAGVLVGKELNYTDEFMPIYSWSFNTVSYLDCYSSNRQYGLWSSRDVQGINVDVVQQIFKKLRYSNQPDLEWDSLALAFEAAIDIKRALKLSRLFLSILPESLGHWDAHASLERIRGRVPEARKIYHTVLLQSPSLSNERTGAGQLWWNWANMEWYSGDSSAALAIILQSVGAEKQSAEGVILLRAKRYLESAAESSQCKDKEAWIQLRALLELLVSKSIENVNDIFDRYLQETTDPTTHEGLTVRSLLMHYIYLRVLRNPGKPALLRERAKKYLDIYSSNSVILGIMLESERGQGMWGHIRDILKDVEADKDLNRRVMEVWTAQWEKGRWDMEIERLRNSLTAATELERGCIIIWRIFIEFEIRVGDLRKAKTLVQRAIRECPFVKELYLLAFGPLRTVYTPSELRLLADTMAEREMRMRQSLDDVVGEEVLSEAGDNESEDEDEIVQNARELQRLKPYM